MLDFGGARGVRFAPSPTGRFHLGNLRTAWLSSVWAGKIGHPWVVRFEDIDQPRVRTGALAQQLEDLKALGLLPSEVSVQTSHRDRHWSLFLRAVEAGVVYPCDCSRQDVRAALEGLASAPHGLTSAPAPGSEYSGHCRTKSRLVGRTIDPSRTLAWRFAWDDGDPSGKRDFIVARTTSLVEPSSTPESVQFVPAYHWACAIDDWDGNFALLVRAHDLANVAELHRAVMHWVWHVEGHVKNFPAVFHASLVTLQGGQRLEKRSQGMTLSELQAKGIYPEHLIRAFWTSLSGAGEPLESNWKFKKSEIFGESRSEISIADLGMVE